MYNVANNVNDDSDIEEGKTCYEIVNKRSKNSNFLVEFDKMWIHGYLHLIGYDHKSNKDFYKMNRKEVFILNYFNKKV